MSLIDEVKKQKAPFFRKVLRTLEKKYDWNVGETEDEVKQVVRQFQRAFTLNESIEQSLRWLEEEHGWLTLGEDDSYVGEDASYKKYVLDYVSAVFKKVLRHEAKRRCK